MKFQIKEVPAELVIPLRHKILRPHQPVEACHYDFDNDEKCFHLAAITDKEEVIGVATFFPEDFKNFQNAFRLRGMASDDSARGLGVGSALIEAAVQSLKQRNSDVLWCNAREVAFGFYQKLGFAFESEMFDIEGIGPHKVMSLKIKN